MDSREDRYLYYLENEDETPTPIRHSYKRDDIIHFPASTILMDYVGVNNWEGNDYDREDYC